MKRYLLASAAAALLTAGMAVTAHAEEVPVDMFVLSDKGKGDKLGTIALDDSPGGLVLKLDLGDNITPGPHGFHVHAHGNCAPMEKDGEMVKGLSAGGHFDPENTGKHRGPSGDGHLGDLPVIYVGVTENGATPTKEIKIAPRLTLADVRGLALMIHANGDNYKDEPKALGGGGARYACGVIPK